MKSIGFLKSIKENERRIALIPDEIKFINNKKYLFFEKGYGLDLGIEDSEYEAIGCHIENRESILNKDIICDPKIGDSLDLKLIYNKTIFGWIHAVQNKDITDILIENKLTAYAWEDMFEDGRHVFWKNNELAGEAGIMHCFLCTGVLPVEFKAAVLGNGNTARGALKMLTKLGVQVDVYTRKMENLFRKNMYQYDIIVNAILWDTKRKDHIIYKSDLKKLKKRYYYNRY